MTVRSPWYQRARRWCQCNLTEIDGRDCSIDQWKRFWKDNFIEGTIVNAGGTVAYYPGKSPFQYRAKYLGERDLLGEFIQAAREENLAVMARMDVNQAAAGLYLEKPQWFARKTDGSPYRSGERYCTCINSDYYRVHIPEVMREISHQYYPDAFGDNSWTGSGRMICYCDNCKRMFREYCGMELPQKEDYCDRSYRLWLQWSIRRRTEIWNHFNEVTREIGGEDCLWLGMLNADFYPGANQARLYDYAQLDGIGKARMLDSQSRDGESGFDQNSVNGLAMDSGLSFKNPGTTNLHNYLRIAQPRHPIFEGFEGTEIVETHGQFYHVASANLQAIAWRVPEFPMYPPEFAYMEDDKRVSGDPAILAGETGYGGRAVYFAVDMDRRYGESRFPDMGKVLASAIRWALGSEQTFTVEGPGELDCKLYRQSDRLILHIVNHSGLGAWPGSVEEYYPVGPLSVSLALEDRSPKDLHCRVSRQKPDFLITDHRLRFQIDKVVDHELIVVELEG